MRPSITTCLSVIFMIALVDQFAHAQGPFFCAGGANCQHGGIHQQPIEPTCADFRTSDLARQLIPNRIVLVGTVDRYNRIKEQTALLENLKSDIECKTGFEVVIAPRRACKNCFPIQVGKFNEQTLLDIAKAHNADTVVYVTVGDIDAYVPMKMESRFLMINVDQSVAIVSGTQRINLGRAATRTNFLRFHESSNLHTDSSLTRQPHEMIEFASDRLANDIANVWAYVPLNPVAQAEEETAPPKRLGRGIFPIFR